ncbi:DUF421 domain-containing protein [Deinococcus sp. D7000]|uniref:DUF421 domain-containing protein n=1 Tax=Deinococcus radiopugnans ATCC 19172 TaxID=585398 RepID=A0A5C4Y3T6_9DEIO|nr:YetF domain-containing protein [Deinococcus radiopugnans]MBB6017188.1 uncharacterized membrane protein YcaP (DUF421 family) [Deinococcus radiopugnans ATCC 19172]QLG09409.1 DUF421 domain-containing protein [Deinococcus sp. D7000]TNM70507.1 DUF421 domain-containing protein [Deinococcus radiopugnans ATCC 19172]
MELLWNVLIDLLTPENGWSVRLVVRIILSTLLLFSYIVILARTFGARTFATFTSYDFLTNVASGSLVASAILGKSIVESSLSLLVLVLLQGLISGLSARSQRAQRVFDNGPVVLVERGQIRHGAMRQARVSEAILYEELRQAGVNNVEGVAFAVLESGGRISVLQEAEGGRISAAIQPTPKGT